jgi:hypothetical protein
VGLWVRRGTCHVDHYLAKPTAMARALESAPPELEPLSARTPSQGAAAKAAEHFATAGQRAGAK